MNIKRNGGGGVSLCAVIIFRIMNLFWNSILLYAKWPTEWRLNSLTSPVVIRSNWKITQPVPDMFCLLKNKLHLNWKRKTMLCYVLEMFTAFSDACIHCFPHVRCVWYNPVKSPCVTEMVHQYCRSIWHKRIGKSISELILASSVRTTMNTYWELWKRHPCTSTIWRQLIGWSEQVTTCCDLYSHTYTVSVNPIELYWIATISKYAVRVLWLFDHRIEPNRSTSPVPNTAIRGGAEGVPCQFPSSSPVSLRSIFTSLEHHLFAFKHSSLHLGRLTVTVPTFFRRLFSI
jgi:hypothetical protein